MANDGIIEIRVDERKLRQVQLMLREIPRAMPRVMSRAVNRTATTARAKLTDRLSKLVALKKKYIRGNIHLRKATYKRWQAELTLGWWPINLRQFGARQTQKGVSYKIDKSGGRKLLPHAFIIERYGGNVFRRAAKGGGGLKSIIGVEQPEMLVPRLPIEIQKGPSLKDVYTGDRSLAARTMSEAMANLNKNIDAQVQLLLARRAAQRGGAA